jgi:hypothetical protein
MLEEVYGKASMKKMQDYGWHKCFFMDIQVSIMIHAGGSSTLTNNKNIERVRNLVQSILWLWSTYHIP